MEETTTTATDHSVWKNRDFVKLWTGQTVSKFGSHITWIALSATATLLLQATPAQLGLLTAAEGLPVLLFGLFAGAWTDRVRRRPILIATDLLRALVLISVPIAALLGTLKIEHLYMVGACMGVLTVLFNVADRAYLPAVLPPEQLVEGNSRLSASDSVAEMGGQAAAGGLVHWLTGPVAILADAATYLFSALCLFAIRTREPAPKPAEERENVLREIREGLRFTLREPALRAFAASGAISVFFGSFYATLYLPFLVRDLGLNPAQVGLTIAAGGIGSLIGAVINDRLTRRFGIGRTVIGAAFYGCVVGSAIPLARGSVPTVFTIIILAQILNDITWPLRGINEVSLRQSVTPPVLLGRANASMEFLTQGMAPLGALAGGVLAGYIGMRGALLVTIPAGVVSALFLYFSPLRHIRSLKDYRANAGSVS